MLLHSYADLLTPVSVFGQPTNRRTPAWVDGDRILALWLGTAVHHGGASRLGPTNTMRMRATVT